jgi:membrane protease YdiL (CAAX protease family)
MSIQSNPPGFWPTVRILVGTARKRAIGRQRRQQELINNRAKKSTFDWSFLGVFFSVLFFGVVNVTAAISVNMAVEAAQRTQINLQGKIVVRQEFLDSVRAMLATPTVSGPRVRRFTQPDYAGEAKRIARRTGGSAKEIQERILDSIALRDGADLVSEDEIATGLAELTKSGRLPALTGALFLVCWIAMLVCQGEGLELDIQRRRHPMWEWLYSHPVPSGAIFFAEMLAPIAANPVYWTGPLFCGTLYGIAYRDIPVGIAAAFLIGIPVTIACACLGKALEIGILLRFPPRTRGGIIGLMSWAGYATMMFFFVSISFTTRAIPAIAPLLRPLTAIPWPWLGLFLGAAPSAGFSFPLGLITCVSASAIAIAGAVSLSVWGTQRGLAGQFAKSDAGPSANRKGPADFGREPLYRKEFLWFIRDRSAVVQTILIPLTLAGYQAFNLRFLTQHAAETWNYLCGAAILFGTYFLWVLGPKSLASEGSALWIALTWPRGLESLLKAKAWLWTLISSGLVALVMIFGCFLFPHAIGKIALIGVAWYFFGRSMAEKSVTLVTITSESGEVQKIPAGRRWAAQLGMFTFAIGICTQQWHLAIIGIVYSHITAAAMWQNFRARLPFLYDPWSETLPAPPTLMHAMVAISILIEAGAILSGIFLAFFGRDNLGVALAFSYALCAVGITVGMTHFLANRNVSADRVWLWKSDPLPVTAATRYDWLNEPIEPFYRRYGLSDITLIAALLAGTAGGLALGMLGHAYQYLLAHLPATQELLEKSQQQLANNAELRTSYFVMAVFFAPFAEEYLFRGLLFRALDREWKGKWHGWLAILASAAFFASYHPVMAWPPVFLLGATNAYLFKKTGKLAPCVLLHMIYNAVVLS